MNNIPTLLKNSTFVKDMADYTEEEILDSLNTAPFPFQQDVTNQQELLACLQSADFYGHELPISIYYYLYDHKEDFELVKQKYEKQNIKFVKELELCLSKYDLMFKAIKTNNVNWLRVAHDNGYEWDEYICKNAAEIGSLECLKYMHEQGCKWDSFTCMFAAQYGHLDCLKYAHENGCECNENVAIQAAMYGRLDCLKYLVENKCKVDSYALFFARANGRTKCIEYLYGASP